MIVSGKSIHIPAEMRSGNPISSFVPNVFQSLSLVNFLMLVLFFLQSNIVIVICSLLYPFRPTSDTISLETSLLNGIRVFIRCCIEVKRYKIIMFAVLFISDIIKPNLNVVSSLLCLAG